MLHRILSVTGAIDVALGSGATGVFTNSTQMWELLQRVSFVMSMFQTLGHCIAMWCAMSRYLVKLAQLGTSWGHGYAMTLMMND